MMGNTARPRHRGFVVALLLTALAGAGLVIFMIIGVIRSLCPGPLCEAPVGLRVVNDSGRVLIVEPQTGPASIAQQAAYPNSGGGELYLAGVAQDNCSPVPLHAIDLDGNEVASIRHPCVGDTWTVGAGRSHPPARHVPAQVPTDLREIRVFVPVSYSGATPQWLRSTKDRTNRLDALLRTQHLGYAQGPYEEDYGLVFYLYCHSPDSALARAQRVLLGNGGPTEAYADTSQPGQRATPTGPRTNIAPDNRIGTGAQPLLRQIETPTPAPTT